MGKLTLIVPCFNEQDNAALFYAEAEKALDGKIEWAAVFINDGSRDNTAAELRRLYEMHGEKVTVINFTRNFGSVTRKTNRC